MKSYWKTLILSSLIFSFFTLIPTVCSAQFGDEDPDPDAPIDGGVGILIAAGIGYGIKRYKDAGKNNKVNL